MTAVTTRRTIALVGAGVVLVALGAVAFVLGHAELDEHRGTGPPGTDYETWHSANVAQRGVGSAVALAGVVAMVVGFATRLPASAPPKPAGSGAARWTEWSRSRLLGSIALYCVTVPAGWVIGSLGFLIGGRIEGLPVSSAAEEVFGAVIFVAGVTLAVSAPAVVAYMRRTRLALAAAGVATTAGVVYAGLVLSRWPPLLEPLFEF